MSEDSDESSHGKRDTDEGGSPGSASHPHPHPPRKRRSHPFSRPPQASKKRPPKRSGSGAGTSGRSRSRKHGRNGSGSGTGLGAAATEEEDVEVQDEDIINEAVYGGRIGAMDADEELLDDIGTEFPQLGTTGGVGGGGGKLSGLWKEIHGDPWSKSALQEYDKVPQYLTAPLPTRIHRERSFLEGKYGLSTHPGYTMGHDAFCFLCSWTSDFSEYRVDYEGYSSISDFIKTMVREKEKLWSVISEEAASLYDDLRSVYNRELDPGEEELPECSATTIFDHITLMPEPEVAAAKTSDYIDTIMEWCAKKGMRRINVVTGEETANDKIMNVAVRLLSLQKADQKAGAVAASGKPGQASGGSGGGGGGTSGTKQIRGVGKGAIQFAGDHTEAMRK